MARPRFVKLVPAPVLAVATMAATAPARPFDPLLPALQASAPGTYVVNGGALVPVPDTARVPVMLQADVLRGPGRAARVGVALGSVPPQAGEARLRVQSLQDGRPSQVVADAGGPATPGPMRLVRELSLAPGEYQIEAIVGDSTPGAGLVSVARAVVSVPDMERSELVVTPIVAGEAARSTRADSLPFIFGPTTLTPAVDRRFAQDASVSVAFRVYGWSAAPGEKPDLTAEYRFYEQGRRGLHFFNQVKPQRLNAETLGSAFDPSRGSVTAGLLVPLGAFTLGEFQLAVKVTDNRSGRSAEQRLAFAVVP